MAIGLGVFGWAPHVFWSMTPQELDAALRGRFGAGAKTAAPARADLAALMARFPDFNC